MDSSGKISIVPLCAGSPQVETLARWQFEEWGVGLGVQTAAEAVAQLATWTNEGKIPLTFVAMADGSPLGSASLVVHDMHPPPPSTAGLSPWLSGVFVHPDRRGSGLGARLVRACEAAATGLGHREMYLFTAPGTAEHFYAPLGWRTHELVEYAGHTEVVMVRELTGVPPTDGGG